MYLFHILLSPLFLCPVGLNLFVRVHYIQVKEANRKMLLTQASQHILYFQLRPVCIISFIIFLSLAFYSFSCVLCNRIDHFLSF